MISSSAYIVSTGESSRGETFMAFLMDFSSIYSENFMDTFPPLMCSLTAFGSAVLYWVVVSSFGPPSGGATAAQE